MGVVLTICFTFKIIYNKKLNKNNHGEREGAGGM